MPDDPLRPLPPEIFMRDYYEPNLLGRLLACREAEVLDPEACADAFRPVPDLTTLNRVQPDVNVVSVEKGSSSDEVYVTVEVSEKEDPSQPNGKTRTGVYDVRLFRDGQLVGQWPEPRDGVDTEAVEAWREVSRVVMPEGQVSGTHVFAVRLPTRDEGRPVEFTAYAFNEDRVKSATATAEPYPLPADVAPRAPRAYVISVGVDAYENPDLNLSFAVADAEEIAASLSRLHDPERGEYEVVRISLLSDQGDRPGAVAPDHATQANIRAVLDLLAGEGEAERSRLREEIGEQIDELQKATPDDLVVLTFSGHGHTGEDGRFHLMPSDSGAKGQDVDAVLDKLISSEELTDWLRDVDAGETVMIIDACHSAGSVPAGFKPGPMGDRGLGQLANDKGMRMLAATQAADVAIESEELGNGLLSYALVEEALVTGEDGRAPADRDEDGAVTLAEWLGFAERRVPGLYADLIAGKLEPRTPVVDQDLLTDTTRHAQTPALVDFAEERRQVVLEAQ